MTRAQLESWLSDERVRAFLTVIARAEGTDPAGKGAGYDVMFTGKRFSDFSRHPKQPIRSGNLTSTAAGRYQFLYSTWAGLATKYGFKDFSPHSQDLGAVALLYQRGALPRILADDFDGAVKAARKEWASFPGAGYGQGERSLPAMRAWYSQAGVSGVARVTQRPGGQTPGPSLGTMLALAAGAAVIGVLVSR